MLLSGSVLASVVHGNLNIHGDAAASDITLDQSGLSANQVRIASSSGATINNQAGPVVLSGITHDVFIRTGGGVDSLTLNNLSLPGNVSLNSMGGADTLVLNDVQIASNLWIHNHSVANTSTIIANSTVGNRLLISAGQGGQTLALQSVTVRWNTGIITGKGADHVTVDDSTFHGAMRLNTGVGADVVQVESNGDQAGPTSLFDGPMMVNMAAGADTLQIGIAGQTGNNAVFNGRVLIDGQSGQNTLVNLVAGDYTGNKRFQIKHFQSNIPAPVIVRPTVSETDPANNETGVALNKQIAATFSEAMNPLTITAANVTVTAPGSVSVPGTIAYVGTTMTFTPTTSLAPDTFFTVTIGTGAKDLAGNSLASSYVWNFTSGATADTTAPTVSSTTPASNATGVALNTGISATFSEAMNPLTINASSVTLTAPGAVNVAGTVGEVGTTMTFTPASTLAANTLYTLTITTGATDLAGNPLASDDVWTFTTGATADTTAPTVVSTTPANGTVSVALNSSVAATFSKVMNPSTVTTNDVTVTAPGGVRVAGAVNYVGTTMTFTPATALTANTAFTVTITTGATDLAGNRLASNYVWTFTTARWPTQPTRPLS